jgi:hypothetical protein
MRVFASILLMAFTLGTAAFALDTFPFKRSDGMWGFVNKDHCWVIEPQFDFADSFAEGLASVSRGRKRGYVNENGAMQVPFSDGFNQRFSGGLAPVQFGRKWGYINDRGKIIIAPQFFRALPFSDGLAAVSFGGPYYERWGYITADGKFAIRPQFRDAGNFQEGLAAIRFINKFGFIDKSGSVKIEPTFNYASRLRTHSQNNTIAASAPADRKISGRRSNRMATLRQSLMRPNIFSIL